MGRNFKLVSFNIRTLWERDGVNSMPHRLGAILEKIDNEKPDIVCFQETIERTYNFLNRHLADYQVIYLGRLKNFDGEGLSLALRKESVQLLSYDYFWLSPTPYLPESRFPVQSEYPRVVQAALVRLKGEETPFWVYNTHLDHISDEARVLGIKQILNKIKNDRVRGDFPCFLLGDFNAFPDSETIKFCDTFEDFKIVNLTKDLGPTFHAFGKEDDHPQIDYIFSDEKTAQKKFSLALWRDEQDGIFLSDHFPVCLNIEM